MSRIFKLPKTVKRITVLKTSAEGFSAPVKVYSNKKKKGKKQSRGLRALERLTRRNAKAQQTYADVYADRHKRSNRKKRDGWLRDLGYNLLKANQKSQKKMRMRDWLRP